MELRQYVMIVWKRWWLIALTTVLAGVAAFTVSRLQTPTYRASTTIEISSGADPAQDPYSAIRDAEAIATTYVLQITSPRVVEAVLNRLGLAMEVESAQRILSASQVRTSSLVEISAVHANPALAQAMANTTAEVFIEQQAAQQQARYAGPLAELDAQVAVLEEKIKGTRGAIASLGDTEDLSPAGRADMARLETELTNDQTRLSVLLNSTEQFRLEMTKSGDYISVFSPAKLPAEPFAPETLRNTALALVVGGMIGVGTAFLLDYLDDTIRTPEDVHNGLGVNVLGTVPDAGGRETIGWLAQAEPLSPIAEAFRNTRTSLQYLSLDAPLATLLVTSTEPDEGKTFVASNIATAFALTGKKVLLLDSDLRRSRVHRLWDRPREPGLTETLKALSERRSASAGDTVARAAVAGDNRPLAMRHIHPTAVDNLYLMTSGSHVSTPAELLSSQTFAELVTELKMQFDLIVMDAPPILTVTDAAILATDADGVLMVMVSGETRLPSAARALDRIAGVGGRLLGVVVNRLSARSGGYYYRYYNYQYDYTYHKDAKNGAAPASVEAPRQRAREA